MSEAHTKGADAYLVYDKGASSQYVCLEEDLGDMDGCEVIPLFSAKPAAEINADLLDALKWYVKNETRLHGFDSAFFEAGLATAEAAIAKAQPAAEGV